MAQGISPEPAVENLHVDEHIPAQNLEPVVIANDPPPFVEAEEVQDEREHTVSDESVPPADETISKVADSTFDIEEPAEAPAVLEESVVKPIAIAEEDEGGMSTPLVDLINEPLVPQPARVDETSSDQPGDDQLPAPSQPEIVEEPSIGEVTPAVEKNEQDVAATTPDTELGKTEQPPAPIVEPAAADLVEVVPVHHEETKPSKEDAVAESTLDPTPKPESEQKAAPVEVEGTSEVEGVRDASDTAESPPDPTLSPLTPIDEILDENVIPHIETSQQGESTSAKPSSAVPEKANIDNATKETGAAADAKQPRRCVIM
jgi:hypothetical protein